MVSASLFLWDVDEHWSIPLWNWERRDYGPWPPSSRRKEGRRLCYLPRSLPWDWKSFQQSLTRHRQGVAMAHGLPLPEKRWKVTMTSATLLLIS